MICRCGEPVTFANEVRCEDCFAEAMDRARGSFVREGPPRKGQHRRPTPPAATVPYRGRGRPRGGSLDFTNPPTAV